MKYVMEGDDGNEKKGALSFITPRTDINIIKQLCILMEIMMEKAK